MLQIDRKEFFLFKNITNTISWIYVLEDINGQKLLECLSERIAKKKIKKNLELKK